MKILKNFFKWKALKDKDGNDFFIGTALDGSPKNQRDIEHIFKAYLMDDYIDPIKPFIKNGISIELEKETISDELCKSRIGGIPDGFSLDEWPKSFDNSLMNFLAQINLKEITEFDFEKKLPDCGCLYFFYSFSSDSWGFSQSDRDSFKVIYKKSDIESVSNFIKDYDLELFQSFDLSFDRSLFLPEEDNLLIKDLIKKEDEDKYAEISLNDSEHCILGYAGSVQGSMELECELYSNGLDYDIFSNLDSTEKHEIIERAKDWILLFQISSDFDKTGMQWGNDGSIYFYITSKDLKDLNFNKAWFIVQH